MLRWPLVHLLTTPEWFLLLKPQLILEMQLWSPAVTLCAGQPHSISSGFLQRWRRRWRTRSCWNRARADTSPSPGGSSPSVTSAGRRWGAGSCASGRTASRWARGDGDAVRAPGAARGSAVSACPQCPFHGPIIPRDEEGRPCRPEDRQREEQEERRKREQEPGEGLFFSFSGFQILWYLLALHPLLTVLVYRWSFSILCFIDFSFMKHLFASGLSSFLFSVFIHWLFWKPWRILIMASIKYIKM